MRYFAIFLSLFVVSCTNKPVCKHLSAAAKLSAVAAASVLDCSNIDAIEADIISGAHSLNLCNAQLTNTQLTGVPFICDSLSVYLADKVKKSIPSAWSCKGGVGISLVQSGIYQACMVTLPVSQK